MLKFVHVPANSTRKMGPEGKVFSQHFPHPLVRLVSQLESDGGGSPSNETVHVKRRPSQTVQTCTYLHLIYADIKILNYLFVRGAQTETDTDTDTLFFFATRRGSGKKLAEWDGKMPRL